MVTKTSGQQQSGFPVLLRPLSPDKVIILAFIPFPSCNDLLVTNLRLCSTLLHSLRHVGQTFKRTVVPTEVEAKQTQPSIMLAPQANRVMAVGEWEERWDDGRTGFHQPQVHKMLELNIDKVLAGRPGVRFFFPLCGKAVDMKWLADRGHSVVGVEISEKAIKQFFEENNLAYSEEPVPSIPGAKVYKSSEKNICLYQCDLYKFSSSIEGQFGAIWDRGSLVAINPRDREKYAALLTSLMAQDCRYLLDTLLYNPDLYPGPPFLVPDEQVHSLFGPSCDVELLQSVDAMTERHRSWNIDYLTENVFLVTLKKV